jgi:aminopeptidase
MDPRVEKMASVLVNYCVSVQPKDLVIIQSSELGVPMVDACFRAILQAGGHPVAHLMASEFQESLIRYGSDEQLAYIDPMTRVVVEEVDCQIGILAPSNTRGTAALDPERMAIQAKAFEPLLETFMQRTADKTLRWTGAAYPTNAGAQDAGMSLRQYEDFVYGAGLLNEPDPVVAWRALGDRQQRLADWLTDKSEVHIKGPGTDLTVGIGGRTWMNDDGHLNFPGGEIYTGPVEDATEGTIQFSYPGYLAGREVAGIRLVFKAGKVVEASASADEPFLVSMLDMDEGARTLGEFAFGLNPGIQQFSKNTLFDEKIGGTLHMALGRAYPESGGKNVSALHWDIVYDLRQGAEVTVDGQLFSRNGEIQVERV